MTDKLLTSVQTLMANKHTSIAALAAFALGVAGILWPTYKDKFDEITKLALVYGLLSAGDASKSAKDVQEVKNAIVTGNTEVLTKTETTNK